MENKQTAVEWLFTQLDLINLLPREKWIEARKEILERAKEMEKEQMFNYIKKNYVIGENSMKFYEEEFEQYYNEIYEKE